MKFTTQKKERKRQRKNNIKKRFKNYEELDLQNLILK